MRDMKEINQASDYLQELLEEKKNVKAQYKVSEITTREITMENGDFTLFRTLFDKEVDISVIADQKKGKTSANSFDKEVLKETLEGVITSAESGSADECFDIAPKNEKEEFSIGCLEPDIDGLMQRAREFADEVEKRFPNILIMLFVLQHKRTDSVYRSTNGSHDEIHSGAYSLIIEYAGNDGENTGGICFAQVDFKDLSQPLMKLGRLEKDLEEAEKSTCPKPVEGKFEGKVIFTPLCFNKLMYFSGAVSLIDPVIVDKSSLWTGKIGEKVASDKVTVSIKPWDERIVDRELVTEDGFRSEDFDVIKDGELKSYCTSLYGAKKAGVERGLNTSNAFVVEPGDVTFEEMVKSIDKGLLVGMISCGFPGVTGEISGVAKNAFYIENGEIKHAVSETMVSFNVVKMYEDVVSLSKEVICDGFSAVPYVCVDHITISGK